jgi:hypothetical protein
MSTLLVTLDNNEAASSMEARNMVVYAFFTHLMQVFSLAIHRIDIYLKDRDAIRPIPSVN